jgi:phosphonate transport system ATP-binding protein
MTAAVAEVTSTGTPAAQPKLDLQVEKLVKSFEDEGRVLNGISFDVERGQSVALIGTSSSGKSTLLRCCVRLIEPDAGSIRLFDEDITALSGSALKKAQAKVGLLSPKTELNPKFSVLRAVIEGAVPRKSKALLWIQSTLLKSERDYAMHCLETVGAAHLAKAQCRELSPADSRRVALARLLMQRPQLVIADEPVADLDVRTAEKTMDLIVGIMRASSISFLFSSHDLVDALSYADRALALHEGRLELDAPVGAEDARVLRALCE